MKDATYGVDPSSEVHNRTVLDRSYFHVLRYYNSADEKKRRASTDLPKGDPLQILCSEGLYHEV